MSKSRPKVLFKKKNEPTPVQISPQKVESGAKKPMINRQVSLASQVSKNPEADNAQHVQKIVELDDFDIEEMEVAERQPLKRLKKTLLLPDAKEEYKQGIETHEEDSQINPKKKRGRPLGSKNNKNNPAASNVIQKRNVPTKKGETL